MHGGQGNHDPEMLLCNLKQRNNSGKDCESSKAQMKTLETLLIDQIQLNLVVRILIPKDYRTLSKNESINLPGCFQNSNLTRKIYLYYLRHFNIKNYKITIKE